LKHFDRERLAEVVGQGADALRLDLGRPQLDQLLDYLALLFKWNSVYILTSVRDPQQMATLHLLDTLAAVPAFAQARRVLDVGAGGGLPGLVLAIARPTLQVALIDTVHKKTAFLTQVKAQLGLQHVTVHTGRVEELEVPELFDTITSRAFADLSDFVNWSGHLLAPGGQFIALKGTAPRDEQERVPAPWTVTRLQALQVPGLEAERHLVFIQRTGETAAATQAV
jgi:16S rRNA (guanine527-N7)-methyltransferase